VHPDHIGFGRDRGSHDGRGTPDHVYEHDGSRYWLKVIVETKDGREGWISGKIIEQEILDLLDLQ